MKLLVIEDDPEISESVALTVRMRWPEAEVTSTDLGEHGLDLAGSEKPDLILLDIQLPDVSGFDVLKRIRLFSEVPVIILTVKGDEVDVVRGLELGADDYITKPFGQLELLARVHARLRGSGRDRDNMPLSVGPLQLNPLVRSATCSGKEVKLTAIECRILYQLMTKSGRVVTYGELSRDIWGYEYPGSVDSLRVHVRRLRAKIESNPASPQLIVNEPGVGYFLARQS